MVETMLLNSDGDNSFMEWNFNGKDFPVIASELEQNRIYLDSAATTQKTRSVIHAVASLSESKYANIHRGVYHLSEETTTLYNQARANLGTLINAKNPEKEVIFTSGTTDSINLAAQAWGKKHLQAGDEIILTSMEHHSNLVPWQILSQETGVKLRELPPDETGCIPLESLKNALTPKTRLLGITHVSNLLGTINNIQEAAKAVHQKGALILVDGAQAMAHLPVDVQELDCDFYAASGHKMFGPTGTGFLYGKEELLESFTPYRGGGDMIKEVLFEKSTYADLPARLEAGTPNIDGVVGLGAAVDYLQKLGLNRAREHDLAITGRALEKLKHLPWLELYGPKDPEKRGGLISFNIKGVHAHDAATILGAAGIAVRGGHLCAMPMLRRLNRTACVRASFAIYTTEYDIDCLTEGLKKAAECFGVCN